MKLNLINSKTNEAYVIDNVEFPIIIKNHDVIEFLPFHIKVVLLHKKMRKRKDNYGNIVFYKRYREYVVIYNARKE